MTLSTPAVGQDRLRDDALLDAIRARVAATPGAIVAVSYNDATGASIARLNADTVFHAASTMKIPVMIEVLRRAQAGAFTMDQPVLLINQFASIVDGSPFSLDAAEDSDSALYRRIGERVPIRELMRRMITHSSNLATNELIALVGAERTTAMARSLGARHMQVLRGVEDQKAFDRGLSNTTTADDLAALLTAIESGRALSPASSAEMRDILLEQAFNEKIPAGLPPGTRVAHKTGEITAVSHDAAIVYPAGRKPYVLVVLTRGVRDGAASSALIADVSRLVYAHAVAGI
ncbi:MAG: serine hydrolase [Gemmatimonadaceae bacterium]|nr:serine hydrolase [Gemmatimonadaceae bacterium]